MLLSLIQQNKQISRAQLATLTKMSNTSVGKIMNELIADELVIEVGQTKGTVGRRATLLEINPEGLYIIGVEIQLNTIRMAVVSLDGDIIHDTSCRFDVKEEAEAVLDTISFHITEILQQLEQAVRDKILAIGISLPGLVTLPEGKTLMVPQFHWKDVEIKAHLEAQLDYIVYVDNDVRAVLLAENLFGSMSAYKNAVCIYIGSGIGGAVMIEGKMIRGHMNTLGEIGHMTLDPDGTLCECERFGCLQTFICSTELVKQAQQPIEEIYAAYYRQEDWSLKLINRARNYLSLAVSNTVLMYNPEAILITGPMVQGLPEILDGVDEQANDYVLGPLRDSFVLKKSVLGRDSGVIGASALVLHEFLKTTDDLI